MHNCMHVEIKTIAELHLRSWKTTAQSLRLGASTVRVSPGVCHSRKAINLVFTLSMCLVHSGSPNLGLKTLNFSGGSLIFSKIWKPRKTHADSSNERSSSPDTSNEPSSTSSPSLFSSTSSSPPSSSPSSSSPPPAQGQFLISLPEEHVY